jgi:hypothetical protein
MAREVMILMRANPLQGSLKGVSTEKQTFVGIEISTSEASAILAPKS